MTTITTLISPSVDQRRAEVEKGNWQLGLNGGWTSSERLSLNDSSRIDQTGNYDGNFADDRYTGQQLNGDLFAHHLGQSWSMLAGINASSEQNESGTFYHSTAFGSVFESAPHWIPEPRCPTHAPYLKIRLGGDLVSHQVASIFIGRRHLLYTTAASDRSGPFELNPSWQLRRTVCCLHPFRLDINPYQLYAPPETYQAWDGTSYTPTTREQGPHPEYSQSLEFGIRQQIGEFGVQFFHFPEPNGRYHRLRLPVERCSSGGFARDRLVTG